MWGGAALTPSPESYSAVNKMYVPTWSWVGAGYVLQLSLYGPDLLEVNMAMLAKIIVLRHMP